MSTSALVRKMQIAAEEQGIDAEIWAVSESVAQENVAKADVILLGPQIRYALNRIQGLDPSKPVGLIDMKTYGMMDGEKVLADAMALYNDAVVSK